MRIVFVCREYPPSERSGGIGTYHKIVANQLKKMGHDIFVICANDDTKIETCSVEDGIHVYRLSGGDFLVRNAEKKIRSYFIFRFIYRFWRYRRKIRNVIKCISNIDIIEVPEYGAEGLFIVNQINIPVVVRLHCPSILDITNLSKRRYNLKNIYKCYFDNKEILILQQARYITSCSESLKSWMTSNFKIPSPIVVINNPINIPNFSEERQRSISACKLTIFCPGTICETKGVGDLIKSCSILFESGFKSFELVLAGKMGKYAIELKNDMSGVPWINIVGKLNRQELFEYYRRAAVVCIPSWWENMPMVCLEAMSRGCIVIGSDSGGMSEIITNGENGYLLPPHQPYLWYKKIKEVFSMTVVERNKVSTSAQQLIRSKFSAEEICKKLLSYYSMAIDDYRIN